MTTPPPGLGSSGHPVALVTLPSGQQVLAEVLERSRSWDGGWWYRLQLVLTRRDQQPGAPDRERWVRVEWEARYPAVEPVRGQDYSALPGVRTPPGLIVCTSRHGERQLHREGCWMLGSHPAGAERIAYPDADALLARGDTRVCPACLSPETPA